MEMKKLTVEFTEETWREFKKAAVDSGKSMKEIIKELVQDWVERQTAMRDRGK